MELKNCPKSVYAIMKRRTKFVSKEDKDKYPVTLHRICAQKIRAEQMVTEYGKSALYYEFWIETFPFDRTLIMAQRKTTEKQDIIN